MITFGAMQLGRIAGFAPDYVKAKIAAARIFELLDDSPAIDISLEDGEKPVTAHDLINHLKKLLSSVVNRFNIVF